MVFSFVEMVKVRARSEWDCEPVPTPDFADLTWHGKFDLVCWACPRRIAWWQRVADALAPAIVSGQGEEEIRAVAPTGYGGLICTKYRSAAREVETLLGWYYIFDCPSCGASRNVWFDDLYVLCSQSSGRVKLPVPEWVSPDLLRVCRMLWSHALDQATDRTEIACVRGTIAGLDRQIAASADSRVIAQHFPDGLPVGRDRPLAKARALALGRERRFSPIAFTSGEREPGGAEMA